MKLQTKNTLLVALLVALMLAIVYLLHIQHKEEFEWIRRGEPKILPDFKVLFWLHGCQSFTRADVDLLYSRTDPPHNHPQSAREFFYSQAGEYTCFQ